MSSLTSSSSLYNNANSFNSSTLNSLTSSQDLGGFGAQTTELMSQAANSLTQKVLSKVSPVADDYPANAMYSSSSLTPFVSTFDVLTSLATNVIPFLNISGTIGKCIGGIPSIFQTLTSIGALFQVAKEMRNTPPAKNELSANLKEDMLNDLNQSYDGDFSEIA